MACTINGSNGYPFTEAEPPEGRPRVEHANEKEREGLYNQLRVGYSVFANREQRIAMVLKPQDVLVLLKLVLAEEAAWSYNRLALDLGMSPSEVHAAIRRALAARLAQPDEARIAPNLRNLEEFLVYGFKYVFVPDRGELTRGLPTLHGAPPLKGRFAPSDEPLPVWPDPEGGTRGTSFSPIYKSAPGAARRDPKLYELLVLVDAIRAGRAREREFAVSELRRRLREHGGRKASES